MAKTLYLTDDPASTHRGDNTAKLNAATTWWLPQALSEARGNTTGTTVTKTVTTVAGATPGIEVGSGAIASEWISEPLSADFTVSGIITLSLWMAESSNSANSAANAVIDKIDGATGAITQIAKTARTTEMPLTTPTSPGFTVTPTSTACKRGDRIRVRVFADDAGTMGTGFTVTLWYDRSTVAQGESWIQFTENLTFEPAGDPSGIIEQFDTNGSSTYGDTFVDKVAQPFISAGNMLLSASAWLNKIGTPTDNLIVELQTDSSGVPSGIVVATIATIAGSSVSGSAAKVNWSPNTALTPNTKYHIVFRRSGAADGANFYVISTSISSVAGWILAKQNVVGTGWADLSTVCSVSLGYVEPIYYLTDTAETINPGSAIEKKALTTRGSGSVNAITNTAAGPTAGIQITGSAGGTAIEWYTPPLIAFNLGGKAKFNIRGLESNAGANASLRAEIAICANDGSSPVVWGRAPLEANVNGSIGELGTSDAAFEAWVSGDDTAVSTNQRLRFRIYVEDCADAPLVTGFTTTTSYNGASVGAAGDTYVMLPIPVLEVPTAIPSLVFPMRASRNALVRR